jgi:hypothetical protein
MTRHISRLTLLVALAACGPERPPVASSDSVSSDSVSAVSTHAAFSPESLLAALAADTTIVETETGTPSSETISALLTRLGVPVDPKPASGGRGCELRGFEKQSDTLSSAPRVRCHMRGGDADVVIEAAVSPEGYAERLFVRDPGMDSTREPLQTIELDLPEPFRSNRVNLFTEDFDADGLRELLVASFEGATGNFGYQAWRYDVASRHFSRDSSISAMASPVHLTGRPCVRQSWNTSAYDHSGLVECFRAGRWVTMWRSGTRSDPKSKVVRRYLEVRVGDSLRVVRSDTLARDRS